MIKNKKKTKTIIFFVPNIDDGGIEKNLIMLSDFLVKNNYKVKIIYTRISSNIKKQLNSNIIFIKTNNFLNFFFLNPRVNNAINCFFYSIINIKFSRNSVLFSLQDHPLGICLSILKKLPSVIRIANHPVGSLKFFNSTFLFTTKLFIKIFFYHFTTVIICNSNETAKYFKNKILIKKKIYSIYNPIIKKISEKKYKRNKFELVTIGRLEKQKNLKGILKAISRVVNNIPEIKLTIIGKGSQKKELKKITKNYKIDKNIYFKKFSNPSNYLKQKGILILNSFFEGLPNILIEGILHKIPIISSNCQSGPKEILKNGKYGYLVKVDNSDDLSKKIQHVILHYTKAIRKTKLAYKSLNRFSHDKQCEKYLKIFKDI